MLNNVCVCACVRACVCVYLSASECVCVCVCVIGLPYLLYNIRRAMCASVIFLRFGGGAKLNTDGTASGFNVRLEGPNP